MNVLDEARTREVILLCDALSGRYDSLGLPLTEEHARLMTPAQWDLLAFEATRGLRADDRISQPSPRVIALAIEEISRRAAIRDPFDFLDGGVA